LSMSEIFHKKQEIPPEVGSFLKETIDGTLRDLLGEESRKATLFHLQVPNYEEHPREFHVHLGGMFKLGAPVIEKMIIRDVYKVLNLRFDDEANFDYEKSMNYAFRVASERSESGEDRGAHGRQ
jgi:hypothetical protein